MSYPFDPKGIGRRTGEANERGSAQNERFSKSQFDQFVRPLCPAPCMHVTAIPNLTFNDSYAPAPRPPTPANVNKVGPIVWADPFDHNKTFGIDLRNGWVHKFNPVYMEITEFYVSDEAHVFETDYASGFQLFIFMYYKDGSRIVPVAGSDGRLFSAESHIVGAHDPSSTMLGEVLFERISSPEQRRHGKCLEAKLKNSTHPVLRWR